MSVFTNPASGSLEHGRAYTQAIIELLGSAVLAQDRPALTGFDQDAWAERLHYAEAFAAESIEEFRIVRRGNLRILERASPEDLRRVGVHAERGEESVAHMMRLYAGHDLLHVRQIARIREAIGA